LEIILLLVKFIKKQGNFFKKKKSKKYHLINLKLEIKPFFQKEKIQLDSIKNVSGIKIPKFFKFKKSLNIFIKLKI